MTDTAVESVQGMESHPSDYPESQPLDGQTSFFDQTDADSIIRDHAGGKCRRPGRPAIEFPENWMEVYTTWKAGKITAKVAMERTHTKRTSFYKLAAKTEDRIQ